MSKRQLHLNAFLMEAGHHEAAWRLPESNARADFDLQHWLGLARLAESAKFDSLFLADGPTLWSTGEFRPPGQLEPITLLTALAGVTERIGLIATASTTYNSPYNLVRRFATLDHISAGRAGWNIVTSADESAAGNFGLAARPDHRSRYERAHDFLDVATKLWDSWETEATVADKATGRYADPARIHPVAHEGPYYSVAGALNVQRPPQGRPLLVQAGSSEDGKQFAARHAEAIFTAHQTYRSAAEFYADVKGRAARLGRSPDSIKILPGVVPILGSTEAEAQRLAAELDDLRVPEFGLRQLANVLEVPPSSLSLDASLPDVVLSRTTREGNQSRADLVVAMAVADNLTVREIISRLGGGRGHHVFVGTPDQLVGVLLEWFEGQAADGFNIMAPTLPGSLEVFANEVIPLLQKRGLFREEYTGSTLRDHYGLPTPENIWHRKLVTS